MKKIARHCFKCQKKLTVKKCNTHGDEIPWTIINFFRHSSKNMFYDIKYVYVYVCVYSYALLF